MALIGVLQTLVDGQVITAAQHNSNYGDIKTAFNTSAVLTDVAKVITVGHTWAASQTFAGAMFTGDLLFTDATFDIGKSTVTRPRDGFFSRNLTLGGTLITAALNVAGGVSPAIISAVSGNNLQLEKTTGAAILFTTGGTTRGLITGLNAIDGLAFYYGGTLGLTLNASGSLVFNSAVSKLVPGATSFSIRNNADGADNLLVSDAGDVTIRGQAIFTSTTQPIRLQNNAQILWRNFANTADAFGIGTDITDNLRVGVSANFAAVWLGSPGKKLSFFGGGGGGGAGGVVQPVVVGAKAGNAALANLMAALGAAGLNLVIDNTT